MNPNRGFSEMYRCYSIAMMQSGSDRDNVSYGGKSKCRQNCWMSTNLPSSWQLVPVTDSASVTIQSYYPNQRLKNYVRMKHLKQLKWIALTQLYSHNSTSLARLNISYPMLFKLINGDRNAHTHAGVLEFIAEEGRVYLPHWVSWVHLSRVFWFGGIAI